LVLFLAGALFFALSNIDRHHLGQHDETFKETYSAST